MIEVAVYVVLLLILLAILAWPLIPSILGWRARTIEMGDCLPSLPFGRCFVKDNDSTDIWFAIWFPVSGPMWVDAAKIGRPWYDPWKQVEVRKLARVMWKGPDWKYDGHDTGYMPVR